MIPRIGSSWYEFLYALEIGALDFDNIARYCGYEDFNELIRKHTPHTIMDSDESKQFFAAIKTECPELVNSYEKKTVAEICKSILKDIDSKKIIQSKMRNQRVYETSKKSSSVYTRRDNVYTPEKEIAYSKSAIYNNEMMISDYQKKMRSQKTSEDEKKKLKEKIDYCKELIASSKEKIKKEKEKMNENKFISLIEESNDPFIFSTLANHDFGYEVLSAFNDAETKDEFVQRSQVLRQTYGDQEFDAKMTQVFNLIGKDRPSNDATFRPDKFIYDFLLSLNISPYSQLRESVHTEDDVMTKLRAKKISDAKDAIRKKEKAEIVNHNFKIKNRIIDYKNKIIDVKDEIEDTRSEMENNPDVIDNSTDGNHKSVAKYGTLLDKLEDKITMYRDKIKELEKQLK